MKMTTTTDTLNSASVSTVLMDCCYDESEDASGSITAAGPIEYELNPRRVELYRQEILDMVAELPDGPAIADGRVIYTADVRLNKQGEEWVRHEEEAEWLIVLGIAVGAITYFAPLQGTCHKSFIHIKE